jgi:hypothetical protein
MIGDDKEITGLPGDEEPVIAIGSGSKMPKTPELMSIEGLEDIRRTDPFLSPFGAKKS